MNPINLCSPRFGMAVLQDRKLGKLPLEERVSKVTRSDLHPTAIITSLHPPGDDEPEIRVTYPIGLNLQQAFAMDQVIVTGDDIKRLKGPAEALATYAKAVASNIRQGLNTKEEAGMLLQKMAATFEAMFDVKYDSEIER